MTVYAPDADVQFVGGTDFYGAVVGRTVSDGGHTALHFDTSLDILGPGAALAGWREMRNS